MQKGNCSLGNLQQGSLQQAAGLQCTAHEDGGAVAQLPSNRYSPSHSQHKAPVSVQRGCQRQSSMGAGYTMQGSLKDTPAGEGVQGVLPPPCSSSRDERQQLAGQYQQGHGHACRQGTVCRDRSGWSVSHLYRRTSVLCLLLVAGMLAASTTTAQAANNGDVVPRVALVSEKAFHLEVLAGFITMLSQDYGKNLNVFFHPLNFEGRELDFGFSEFLDTFDHTRMRAAAWLGIPRYDVAIFVSPEYRVPYVREFLRQAQPKLVIFMVHNGDAETLPQLVPMHPNIHFMTLSPHVQKFVEQRLNLTVNWMLPLKALKPRSECADDELATCLSGFAIQGAMDSRRRNYGSIFGQVDKLINSSDTHRKDMRLKINVVGSGKPEKLGVPVHLEGRILPHINLRFQDFYELIHSNFALLPALASDAYYDRKFSSTLITSLVTSVPVVVDARFLRSYSFLSEKHVIFQTQPTDTNEALVRLLNMKSSELARVRRNVGELREQLSKRALGIIKQLVEPIMPQVIEDYNTAPW